MNNLQKGLCWAASIMVLWVGNAAGLVDDASVTTLFAVLPVLAAVSLLGGRSCTGRTAA